MQGIDIHPQILFLYIAIVVSSIILLIRFYKKREQLKKKYFLLFNQNKFYYIKYIFLLISLLFISTGLLNIKYGEKVLKQKIKGVDIAFVVDVSKSMNALDFEDESYKISRLDFTKGLIHQYINNNPTNRYGLVIFAGDAISASPLTTDHSTFLTFLQNVNYQNLSKQGTNIEKAVELGISRLFSQKGDKPRAKALILMSDGGDEGDSIDSEYLKNLTKEKKVISVIVGVGKLSGTQIPTGRNMFGQITYQKYKGKNVITKLNTSLLSSLASSVDGTYTEAKTVTDINKISILLQGLEKKAIEIAGGEKRKDFGRILSILAFISFLIYTILLSITLTDRTKGKKKHT